MRKTVLAVCIACLLGQGRLSFSADSSPALALAKVYQMQVDISDYWVSEKLDGARCYWDGEQLLSRNGHVFHAPDWFVRGFPSIPLDGELWMGRGSFEALMQTIRDKQPDHSAWRQVQFWVFDLPAVEEPFEKRQARLQHLVGGSTSGFLKAVEQRRVASADQLQQVLHAVEADGGEGLMLQRGGGAYRAGRHSGLLKVKSSLDAEAIIIGYTAGKGKYRGLVGALVVRDAQGREFKLGSGLSDALRAKPPVLGTQVSYRYQGRTAKGLPRFARYLRLRPME